MTGSETCVWACPGQGRNGYRGPVLLLHGDRNGIEPMWCSECCLQTYGGNATLQIVEGENHTVTRRRKQAVAYTVDFFKNAFGL